MIKLCGFRLSNYYNKVRLVLLEKGVPHEEDATIFPSQDPALLARSPMGKLPFLETEHGLLCESEVMCEYIEDLHPAQPLFPTDPFARAKVREIVQVLELHIELVARRLYGQALYGTKIPEAIVAETQKALDKGIRAFRHLAKFGPYLAGAEFTMADCAAAMHLPLIKMGASPALGGDCLAVIPELPAYLALLGERPMVQQVWNDRDEAFRAAFSKRPAAS